MLWRILLMFVKPVVLVALFELVSRLAEVTGLHVGLIAPIAGAIAGITGLDPRYAAFGVLAFIAGSLFKALAAVYGLLATSLRH
ncbi:MAG: hypothetical protein ABSG79_04425 [Bryobacteraceae bacterium]|jgi:hypothetical protein